MQVLTERQSGLRLVGRSSFWGFAMYGDVDTEELLDAAREGLRRLKAGDERLAVHPNCGSNYAVAGTIAGAGAFVALGGLSRDQDESFGDRLSRLPLACAVGILGVILSRPLGAALQAHVTTEADVGDLRIARITKSQHGNTTTHLVYTEA